MRSMMVAMMMAAAAVAGGASAATYNVGFENSADPDTGPEDRAGNVS